ncbi:MAG: trypsin-like peptidase domain-containing protein [Armatimonadetes bacterium]|nr:trypsin-like peptidase domain-containing protein [Armatimonadota bacterium]
MKFIRRIIYYCLFISLACLFISLAQCVNITLCDDNGLISIAELNSNSIVPLLGNINDTLKIVGTGFYVSGNGHILTASHIAQIPELFASFYNKLYKCQVIIEQFTVNKDNPDISKRLNWDIGLLKIDAKDTKPVKLSGKKDFRVGEQIAMIGFFERGASKKVGTTTTIKDILTVGYISSVFPISLGDVYLGTRLVLDITAGPGSSGSPIFELENGEVIGVLNSGKVRKIKLINYSKIIKIPLGIADAEPVHMLREHIKNEISK